MIDDSELAAVRESIRVRQRRADEVERRRQLVLSTPTERRALTISCDAPHRGGKSPKMAEVQVTEHGTFFVSRIPWAPSDATALRPWIEESHLVQLFRVGSPEFEDDGLLRSAIENLNWWKERGPGDLFWIAKRQQRVHVVQEVLDLPYTDGRRTLWVRCPLHLNDFERMDATRLIEALR